MSGGRPRPDIPLRRVLERWDALAGRWGLDADERSSLLGGLTSDGRIDDVATYDAGSAERRMRLLAELGPVLAAVHADAEHTRRWLRRPNAALGGSTPLQVMASSPQWIRWIVDAVGIAA